MWRDRPRGTVFSTYTQFEKLLICNAGLNPRTSRTLGTPMERHDGRRTACSCRNWQCVSRPSNETKEATPKSRIDTPCIEHSHAPSPPPSHLAPIFSLPPRPTASTQIDREKLIWMRVGSRVNLLKIASLHHPQPVAPERIWKSGGSTGPERKWGHRSYAKRRKILFGRAPSLLWLQKYN